MNPYMKKYEKEIMEIIETCHRDAEIGYGPAVSGNVSYRVDEDIVLITPTKTPKRLMRPEDICVLNMAGEPLYLPEGKKPTGETFMHLHVLSKRPDINAVMHAHPPLVTALSTTKAGKEALLLPLIPEAMMQLGPVITIPYANPNMEELGYAFDPVVNDSNGFMLESHGALVCSPKGVLYAIESLQVMESLAESIIVGRIMSKKLKCLTREDAEGIDGVIHELGWALPVRPEDIRRLPRCSTIENRVSFEVRPWRRMFLSSWNTSAKPFRV